MAPGSSAGRGPLGARGGSCTARPGRATTVARCAQRRDRVAALPDGAVTEEGRAILLDSPELVDDALLRLALELGDGAAPHRRVASYPAPPATSAAPQDGVTPSGETTRRQDASLY